MAFVTSFRYIEAANLLIYAFLTHFSGAPHNIFPKSLAAVAHRLPIVGAMDSCERKMNPVASTFINHEKKITEPGIKSAIPLFLWHL